MTRLFRPISTDSGPGSPSWAAGSACDWASWSEGPRPYAASIALPTPTRMSSAFITGANVI